ncbi:MAG: response regulator [Candidatus Latescibacteria bacterium]|nr:response regulator [Candidatus Latescibacterota bacterium]NIO29236.1 response regulator [Candidatus Latescibacterota bacterium]NIO56860.1 response regulator [Candidatus Latescibacterota bacterium]
MKILLADDDRSLRRVLQFKLKKNGHDVTAVEDGNRALDQLREDRWDLLLSDIKMPNVDGIELLEYAKQLQPDLKVILITAYATISQAVRAVKLGAFDYITKPFEDDELFAAIDKATAFRKLERENKLLRGRLEQNERTGKLIGVSRAFKEMMRTVDKIAATEAIVLLTGPSGTGKELVARTIHAKSERAGREFIAVNCGAIPSNLIESELFGHVKGAFTGAIKDKKGKFELANGGTILLDEIGELAVDLQVRLLRVLQERVVEPVGSEQWRQIDVRVIGATNADLQKRVAQGKFREDLFYRLNVIPIEVPTLAERKEDIPALVKEFVRRYAPNTKVTASPELIDRLSLYSWPGNIRELENLVERIVILRKADVLSVRDLPNDFGVTPAGVTESASEHLTYHEAEEKIIREALNKCGWNRTKAAKYLNIPRHVLLYRMKKYRIEEMQQR